MYLGRSIPVKKQREEKPMHSLARGFDPDGLSGPESGIFGLPFSPEESSVILVPAPYEYGCSQGSGCSAAPDKILEQSRYVELLDPYLGKIYQKKIAMDYEPLGGADLDLIAAARPLAEPQIDKAQTSIFRALSQQTTAWLELGKSVGIVGGDHSVSLGSISAHIEKYPQLGVLQIDAHCDLRADLEGLKYSHASVMYHAIEECGLQALSQVGIRAVCEAEADYIAESGDIHVFHDMQLHEFRALGQSWDMICDSIIGTLPDEIYLTVDIDALDPSACSHTGTPVPGGLSYNDLLYLLHKINRSGKRIIGFDLVEVGDHDTDALIAAHLLYQLCGLVSSSSC